MAERFILIAGVGHSGTTFLARLLAQAGYDFGHNMNTKMEHWPTAMLGTRWDRDIPLDDSLPDFTDELAAPYQDDVREISEELPEVIKCPWLTRWLPLWLKAGGRRPDLVVVSFRSVYDVRDSWERIGARFPPAGMGRSWTHMTLMSYGLLFHTITIEQLPYCLVRFPLSTRDARHVYDSIPFLAEETDWEEFARTHERVAAPGRVHIKQQASASS